MPPTHMFAHHRGGQRQPTPGNAQRPTPNAQHPTPITNAQRNLNLNLHPNLNHILTWQTLPGSQSEQRSLAERQGSLWTRLTV